MYTFGATCFRVRAFCASSLALDDLARELNTIWLLAELEQGFDAGIGSVEVLLAAR